MAETLTLSLDEALRRGVQLHRTGRFQQAEPFYRGVLGAQPKHADALHLLGLIALDTGRQQEALDLIGRAIAQAPKSAAVTDSLGRVFSAMGRHQEALEQFQRATTLDPQHHAARNHLKHARNAIRFFPQDPAETVRDKVQQATRIDPALGEAHRSYQENVNRMRSSHFMDYPAHVHLETYALCNAACDFCPHSVLARRGVRMPDALIEKIIDDLTDVPDYVSFQLSPMKVNEPFLDHRLFDVLAQCNERLPQARLALTSNGSPINEIAIDRLAEVRNLSYLWISLNDHRQGQYEQTMGLPYQRTCERLRMLHERKARNELATRIILSRVGDGSHVDTDFCNWVAENFPLFESSVFGRGDWLGQVDTRTAQVPNVGCIRWFDLSITATGEVAHCCMDGQAEWPIGDVRRHHVLKIYNAPRYRRLRQRMATRDGAKPCDRCTFL